MDHNLEDEHSKHKWLATVTDWNNGRINTFLKVNVCEVRFHLDTGLNINAVCQRFVIGQESRTFIQVKRTGNV